MDFNGSFPEAVQDNHSLFLPQPDDTPQETQDSSLSSVHMDLTDEADEPAYSSQAESDSSNCAQQICYGMVSCDISISFKYMWASAEAAASFTMKELEFWAMAKTF